MTRILSLETVANLRYVHGAYNLALLVAFCYQGLLGFRIRRGRLSGTADTLARRRHRRMGPVLAPLGVAGFFAGLTLVYVDRGAVAEFPLHFSAGLLLALLITGAFVASRRINDLRRVHFALGVAVLSFYAVQAFLGLGILF
jgi:hypothetical protein